jgi:hypothetical protein
MIFTVLGAFSGGMKMIPATCKVVFAVAKDALSNV